MPADDREMFAIEPSPTPELTIEAYSPARHPEFAPMLRELPSLHGAEDRAAVLSNTSPYAVTAVVVRWTYADYRNVSRSSHVVWDSYSPLSAAKPITSGEHRLVTLNGISAPIDVTRPYVAVSAGSGWVHMARDFKVGVDSAVFEGGQGDGRDSGQSLATPPGETRTQRAGSREELALTGSATAVLPAALNDDARAH
jgi:hypothetical protein